MAYSLSSARTPIFDGTLRENLVFDDVVTDAALIEAIRKRSGNLYSKLESGLDTALGEVSACQVVSSSLPLHGFGFQKRIL